ncbi:N-acetyltransferase RimI/Ard1 like protein, partial [Aduncisulcus paluster]
MKSAEVISGTQKIFDLGPEHLSQLRALESLCFEYYWTEEQFQQGMLVGYLAYSIVLDEMEILNLGVHPEFRRKGIGRALMLDLMQRCREMNVKRGLLDVKESNAPAIGLYESLGFVQVGVRKNYYPDTREDALL